MDVIKILLCGYCYGVVDVMVIVKNVLLDKSLLRFIYIFGMIVYNKYVIDVFEEEGIFILDGVNCLDILKQVEKGIVIFIVYGVFFEVRRIVEEKGLVVIDVICLDVIKIYNLILEMKDKGYYVIYVGKKGYLEFEGVVGVVFEIVYLVEIEEDVKNFDI